MVQTILFPCLNSIYVVHQLVYINVFWKINITKSNEMKITFQVMLLKRSNFKTLQSKINIVKNTCACFRKKSQNISSSTFDQREFKKKYFDKNVSRVRERAFFTLSRTLDTFSSK